MRARLVLTTAAVSAALLLGATAQSRAARPAASNADAARAVEVARIRAHFDSVLTELPARDLTALTPAQRGRRLAALETLRRYRDRGDFPHNYDFPGRAVPYFVDRETGVLCAVAHLLASTGRRDVVDRVARADNNVWVDALAADTAFTAWLDAHGLTLAEAARIQVPYVEPTSGPVGAVVGRSGAYAATSAVALGGSLAVGVWNARSNARGARSVRSALGAALGTAALGVGVASLGVDGASPVLGAASAAAGAASLWVATRGVVRHRHDLAVARQKERSLARRAVVTPILPVGRDAGTGLSVSVPF
jgi:hypothetical protein